MENLVAKEDHSSLILTRDEYAAKINITCKIKKIAGNREFRIMSADYFELNWETRKAIDRDDIIKITLRDQDRIDHVVEICENKKCNIEALGFNPFYSKTIHNR